MSNSANDNNLLDNATLDGIERHLNNPNQCAGLYERLIAARPFAPVDKELRDVLQPFVREETFNSIFAKAKPVMPAKQQEGAPQ